MEFSHDKEEMLQLIKRNILTLTVLAPHLRMTPECHWAGCFKACYLFIYSQITTLLIYINCLELCVSFGNYMNNIFFSFEMIPFLEK